MKLCCAILLRLGLNGVKISWNLAKFCMHSCLSNGHPNLWSNFNSKKLFKSKTSSSGFARVGLRGGQNRLEHYETWFDGHLNIWSSFNFENLFKSETPSCGFVTVWLKGPENSSEHRESWRAVLSSKHTSKSMIKF